MFMHLIGFDILIFVPTCFRSVDGLVTNKFQYEIHNIGYASYDIYHSQDLEVYSKQYLCILVYYHIL